MCVNDIGRRGGKRVRRFLEKKYERGWIKPFVEREGKRCSWREEEKGRVRIQKEGEREGQDKDEGGGKKLDICKQSAICCGI